MTNSSINVQDRMKRISNLIGFQLTALDFDQFANVSAVFDQYPWLATLVSGVVAGVTAKHPEVQQVVDYTTAITVGVLSDLNAILPAGTANVAGTGATPLKKASA